MVLLPVKRYTVVRAARVMLALVLSGLGADAGYASPADVHSGQKIYIPCEGKVSIIDAATHSVKNIDMPGETLQVVRVTQDASKVYLASDKPLVPCSMEQRTPSLLFSTSARRRCPGGSGPS
jgi:hypothetical protein